MATKVTKYSSNFLKGIRSLLTLKENLPYFLVEPEVRSNIINLGIRKYKRPYRRSRAGKNLFFKVHTVLTQWRKTRSTKCDTGSNLSNLIEVKTVPVTNKAAHICHLKCALLNCHSIVNKNQDLHIELCTNNIDFCALTETWIKEDNILTPKRMCPQGIWLHLNSKIRQSRRWISSSIQEISKCDIMQIRKNQHNGIPSHESSHNINVIYRPPDTNVLSFITDLMDLLESQITSPGPNHYTRGSKY